MKYTCIFLLVFLVSCAGNPAYEGSELRYVFDQFKLEKNDSDLSQYFTKNMWQEYLGISNGAQESIFNTVNNFPNELTVSGSMEAARNNKGCLIVQGKDRKGQAMDYNITLLKLDDRWRFSDISVTLYDSGQKRWLTEPVCDTEKKQLLWFKYKQQQAQ